jgi:succinate-semialdehyde dehydrogenase/glutarate-semialdehyde dehydrogenase
MNKAMNFAPPLTLGECRLLVDGQWVAGADTIDVLDKFRLTPCTQLHRPSREQIAQAVASAHAEFRERPLTAHERGAILDRAAVLIEQRGADFVRAM